MWALFTMMCFSPWISNVELKLQIGNFTCGLVVLHFLVNLVLMTCGSCRNLIKSRKFKGLKKQQTQQRKVMKDKRALNRDARLQRRSEKVRRLEQQKQDEMDMQFWEDVSISSKASSSSSS